jgi:hypothetical protein
MDADNVIIVERNEVVFGAHKHRKLLHITRHTVEETTVLEIDRVNEVLDPYIGDLGADLADAAVVCVHAHMHDASLGWLLLILTTAAFIYSVFWLLVVVSRRMLFK